MAETVRTGNYAVPASKLWELVSDFGGLDKVMGIESMEVEGEGVGSLRTIPMGGGTVVESLDVLDHAAMHLVYSIINDAPLPFEGYSASMQVDADGDDASTLTWTGTFEPKGVPVEKAEKLAGNIYDGGIAGFHKALGD
jgi:hypothetical protein